MKPGDKVFSKHAKTEGVFVRIDEAGWAMVQLTNGTLHTHPSNLDLVCDHPEHDSYPIYGVGPHICFYKLGLQLGQSKAVPQEQWPHNFTPDADEDLSVPGAPVGVWTCPGCTPKRSP